MTGWTKESVDKKLVKFIAEKYFCNKLMAYLLVARGITSDDEIPYFLSDDLNMLHNPYNLPDMQKAVNRIIKAKKNNEKVLIFGDRDTDGITGTALLVDFLQSLGLDTYWRIPIA